MGDKFDFAKESHYLQYLDANNLYGWAMGQPLPADGFKWVSNPDKLKGSIIEMGKKVGKSYLLEVDVSYPQNLHSQQNSLPFMYEKRKINNVQKLVPNLYDKKKYVIHIATLDQALKNGLILKQIHWVIEFVLSTWLAPKQRMISSS